MADSTLILLALLILGALSGNNLIAVATALLLLLQLAGWREMLRFLEGRAVELGVIFLVIGLLLPFTSGRWTLGDTVAGLFKPAGLIAVLVGVLSAHLASEGLGFLREEPEALIGFVAGSVLGVYFFGGIPNGPLMAAGITAYLYRLLR